MATTRFASDRASVDTARAAQTISVDFANAISTVTMRLTDSVPASAQSFTTGGICPRVCIVQIGQLAESAMHKGRKAAAQTKSDSAKLVTLVVAFVIVVVTVIVASFTLGFGSPAVAAAAVAASALVGQARRAAGKTTGAARVVSDQLCDSLQRLLRVLRNLQTATDTDRMRVLAESIQILNSLGETSVAVAKVSGTCGADLRIISESAERIDHALVNLLAYLRRLRFPHESDGQALLDTITGVRRVFNESKQQLLK